MTDNTKEKGLKLWEFLVGLFLLTVLALIGTIFLLRARDNATLRSTVKDMARYSEAISDYIKDHGKAPSNPYGHMHYKKELVRELESYLGMFRCTDWWGHPFRIWTGPGNRIYGLTTTRDNDFIIASFGKKGLIDGWKYDPEDPDRGGFALKTGKDFESDIVLMNGEWVRAPFFILDKNPISEQAKNIDHKDGNADGSAR